MSKIISSVWNPITRTIDHYLRGSGVVKAGAAGPATPDQAGVVTSYTPLIKSSVYGTATDYTIQNGDGYSVIMRPW